MVPSFDQKLPLFLPRNCPFFFFCGPVNSSVEFFKKKTKKISNKRKYIIHRLPKKTDSIFCEDFSHEPSLDEMRRGLTLPIRQLNAFCIIFSLIFTFLVKENLYGYIAELASSKVPYFFAPLSPSFTKKKRSSSKKRRKKQEEREGKKRERRKKKGKGKRSQEIKRNEKLSRK